MSSATDIEFADHDEESERRRRRVRDTTLVAGIVLIALFLGVFVLEFSQILSIAGKVEHVVPIDAEGRNSSPEIPE